MKNRWVVIALAASTASASPIVYAQSAGRALTFVPAPGGMLVEPTIQIAVADFNGDGRQDVFVAAHGYDAPPMPESAIRC